MGRIATLTRRSPNQGGPTPAPEDIGLHPEREQDRYGDDEDELEDLVAPAAAQPGGQAARFLPCRHPWTV